MAGLELSLTLVLVAAIDLLPGIAVPVLSMRRGRIVRKARRRRNRKLIVLILV